MSRAVLCVFLTLVLLAACGGGGSGSSSNTIPPPTPVDLRGHTQVEIDANANRFNPASIIIDEGTTVTFKNKDPISHNVHKSADAVDFGAPFGVDTADFGPGQSYSFKFAKPGTFAYTCTIHALMDGTVKVVAGAAATPTT
jgi:plastocyanin